MSKYTFWKVLIIDCINVSMVYVFQCRAHGVLRLSCEDAIRSLSQHFNVQFISRYACGKWQDEHPIPDKSLINSWFEERKEKIFVRIRELLRKNKTDSDEPWAVSQAKLLYNSCVNVRTLPVFDSDFSFH